MNLNLALDAIVGAGSGIAFALVGLLAAFSRGGGRARPLLATACVALGVVLALTSLTYPDNLTGIAIVTIAGVVGALAFAAFAVATAAPLAPRARVQVGVVAVGVTALGGVLAVRADFATLGRLVTSVSPALAAPTGYAIAAIFALERALPLVWLAAAARARAAPPEDARAWSMLAVAFAAYPFSVLGYVGLVANDTDVVATALLPVLVAFTWFPTGFADARIARRTFFALLGIGVFLQANVLLVTAFGVRDVGVGPLLTIVGAFLLAREILKGRVLGIAPPALTVARGPVAAGALALLFVVAQVAQNLFSAQYGLIMGGIVAGAFLFAAQPLQRAFEGRFGGRVVQDVHHVRDPAAPAPARSEDIYRDALRIALRDRVLTREEEVRLHRVAEGLGIGAGRAHEILLEVEREAQGGSSR